MSSKKILVELFFDVISPYSYVTYGALTKYQNIWKNMDLRLTPVYLAGIMGATGNKPPAMVPAKGKYMNKDLKNITKFFDLPYQMPKNAQEMMFVKGTVKAQRLLTSVSLNHPKYLQPLADALYTRFWVKGSDVTENESLKEACKVAGIPEDMIGDLVESIHSNQVKNGLKIATQKALDVGCFGLPMYVAHLEDGPKVMFGSDRLFLLSHYLNEKWPGSLKELNIKGNVAKL